MKVDDFDKHLKKILKFQFKKKNFLSFFNKLLLNHQKFIK